MAYGTVKDAPFRTESESAPLLHDAAEASPESAAPQADNSEESRLGRFKQATARFFDKNLGLFFVFIAQFFASIMAMTTRLLATSFEIKFHALQIIFVRMFFTGLIGSIYMWYKKVPGFPLGPREVRGLLVIRGTAGSIGLFGLYYSLSYLDVSDATVITFLVPTLTAFVCWVVLKEPFTVNEALAGLLAFVGVLFIARPSFLFPNPDEDSPSGNSANYSVDGVHETGILPPVTATPAERSIAVICAVIGTFAAATAYATIRVIGKRTHSLVSVNYFAVLATVMSCVIILVHPQLSFKIPQTPVQWVLLCSIGISGFLLQVFLTEGLQREKAGRATNLIYTQLVFALIIEYVVWGTVPSVSSLIGSVLVIGAAVWVSVQKRRTQERQKAQEREQTNDEERRLLENERS